MRLSFILYFILNTTSLFGQDEEIVFDYLEFIEIVKSHHPLSHQANLKIDKGEANLRKQKGQFDPKLQGDLDQKYLGGNQYYSYLNAGLKIPTWFGISAQTGYNQTKGDYINPDRKTSEDGLWYAGLSVNLGQGLFIDQRRADIQQAKIYLESSEIEQKLMLNQLVFDASIAYWQWHKAYNKVLVFKSAIENAELRFENVKTSALFGDLPQIDTLKALIQVQNRQLKLEQAILNLNNKKVYLETFLWQDGYVPLQISNKLIPKNYLITAPTRPQLNYLNELDSIIIKHPNMLYYENDIAIEKIEYRLIKDKLKPTIKLKYNTLSEPTEDSFIGNFSADNYNWGAQIVYPVFTRKERGEKQLSKIKVQEKELQLISKKAELEYKVTTTFNTWLSTFEQVNIYTETVSNYILLFDSEYTLFNAGESSLFLVNFREQTLIDAQIKLIDLLYSNYYSYSHFNFQIVDY